MALPFLKGEPVASVTGAKEDGLTKEMSFNVSLVVRLRWGTPYAR